MIGVILSEMKLEDYAKECQVETMEPTPYFFLSKRWSPLGKEKGCCKIVCNVQPQKDEVNRSRLIVGGDRNNFEGDHSTPTTNLLIVKLPFNSIISTLGEKCLGFESKESYHNILMDCPEYLQMKLADFPDDIIAHYTLKGRVTKDGFIFCKICKGMYDLSHTGLIAQHLLEKRLEKHEYHQRVIYQTNQLHPNSWLFWRKVRR